MDTSPPIICPIMMAHIPLNTCGGVIAQAPFAPQGGTYNPDPYFPFFPRRRFFFRASATILGPATMSGLSVP